MQADCQELKVTLGYMVNSRSDKDTLFQTTYLEKRIINELVIDRMACKLLCKEGRLSLFLILRRDGRKGQSSASGVRSAQSSPSFSTTPASTKTLECQVTSLTQFPDLQMG